MNNNAPLKMGPIIAEGLGIHPVLKDMGEIKVIDRFWMSSPDFRLQYEITEFLIDGTLNFIVKTKKNKPWNHPPTGEAQKELVNLIKVMEVNKK